MPEIFNSAIVGKFFENTTHDPSGYLRAYEEGVCARIFEKLWQHYPGYDWRVKANCHAKHGMVTIQLPSLMRQELGYNFPVTALDTDPGLLIVVKAGGEILERWKLSRIKAREAEYADARKKYRVISQWDEIPGGLKGETSLDRAIRKARDQAAAAHRNTTMALAA